MSDEEIDLRLLDTDEDEDLTEAIEADRVRYGLLPVGGDSGLGWQTSNPHQPVLRTAGQPYGFENHQRTW